ncbi:DRS2 [Brettanomyces bruxellensis]|uniref:Phospholipid-transporting ATPase n=1 Tax=Dekkera bruxellensis TaxID=5007 RepID=A0A7D9CV89_DEKBR|nr:DRS2 [Brettanomyces bruxellensis]
MSYRKGSQFVIDDDDFFGEDIQMDEMDPFADGRGGDEVNGGDMDEVNMDDMGNSANPFEEGGGVGSGDRSGNRNENRNGDRSIRGNDRENELNTSHHSLKTWASHLFGRIKNITGHGRKQDAESRQGTREVFVNSSQNNEQFCDNRVSTAKYNAVTFLPKFLAEQFSKYANVFFLFTSLIQQVPTVSPTGRYTTIGTLAVVIAVSAVKEVHEDLKRRAADEELNQSRAEILDVGLADFVSRRWTDVRVGQVVKVQEGEAVPADMVILSTSEPDGLCYVETANLDGETNLKIKQARQETAGMVSPGEISRLEGRIVGEQPNSSLYTYEGTLYVAGGPAVALSPDQVLLRGATVKNTRWVQGVAIFTGHDSKLMQNATAAPIKTTDMERIINRQILALLALLVLLSVVSSLGDIITLSAHSSTMEYVGQKQTNKAGLFFLDILTYWILYSNLVPISLFVTVEIIKYYQAYLIGCDLDLYYEPTDTPTVARTSSLVDELGQIGYVFSDKTGTLTRNVMEFRACSIAGRCYTDRIPEGEAARVVDGVEVGYRGYEEMEEIEESEEGEESKGMEESEESEDPPQDNLQHHPTCIRMFLTLLATCHTVIPEVQEDGSVKYQASSLDEGALVEGARRLGYEFRVRKPASVGIRVGNEMQEFKLLNICEFNSTRKRMSCVFRCPDGRIRVFVKGADSVVFSRLEPQSRYVEATAAHLEAFAGNGLRTLCLAERVVGEKEYREWNRVYQAAAVSVEARSRRLDEAAEQIETHLHLLGATAIEDKLQDGVPETVRAMQQAGIKVWVLTGDRQETAINVGMSCGLLSEDMNLLIVNEQTREATRENIADKLSALEQAQGEDTDSLALVIDGRSLGFALEPEMEDSLLALALRCKAVLCCRVSPLQKALVVRLVKRKTNAILLAVGDGANDVSMIQAAHVGVGISGLEGMQAARAADFSVGQFRFLRKLLLVHGAWSYHRLSQAILYSFYKNIVLYMCQFWFAFSNGFSGQSIVESWTLTMYNVIFLALPPFVIGIFDQYISQDMLLRYPRLYTLGQHGHFFNVQIFWAWAANAFYHSGIIFLAVLFIYRRGNALPDGNIANIWVVGITLYTSCLLTSLGKAALVSSQWTKFTLLAIPGSFLMWLIAFPLYAVIAPRAGVSLEYWGVFRYVYGSPTYWLAIIVIPVLCLLRDFLWKYYKRNWNPEMYHEVQRVQKYHIQDHRPKFSSFQSTIRKVRQVRRMRKQRGFAFSQTRGQGDLVRKYDTTKTRGRYGELQ